MSKNVLQGGGIGQKATKVFAPGPLGGVVDKVQTKVAGMTDPNGGADAARPGGGFDDSATKGVLAQSAADRASRAAAAEQERKAAGLAAGASVTDNQYDTLGSTGRGITSKSRRALLG